MMTTQLDSFDASPFDCFIESDADARNRDQKSGRFVLFVWLDYAADVRGSHWLKAVRIDSDPDVPQTDPLWEIVETTFEWDDVGDRTIPPRDILLGGPYDDGQLLLQDVNDFRAALQAVEDAGHDIDEAFTFVAIQGTAPNINLRVNVGTVYPLSFPHPEGTIISVESTNFAGPDIIGAVVAPVEHVVWSENNTLFDWRTFFEDRISQAHPLFPEQVDQVQTAFGEPPWGGPYFRIQSLNAHRSSVEAANRQALSLVFPGGLAPEGTEILNYFMPPGVPNQWVNLLDSQLLQVQRDTTGATVSSQHESNARWYRLLAQEVARLGALLPSP